MKQSYIKIFSRIIYIFAVTTTGYLSASAKPNRLSIAKAVISNIDYIPFSSKTDGCYARALYMGMELAIHGIPSSNQYIFGSLKPTPKISWRYHVAPLVEVGGHLKYAIFDPSFASTPLSRGKWIRMNKPKGSSEIYVSPPSHYKKTKVQRLSQQRKKGYGLKSLVKKVKSTPLYDIRNIADACRTAWNHIGKERSLTAYQRSQKRSKLNKRTSYLVHRLKELNILKEGAYVASCKKGTHIFR